MWKRTMVAGGLLLTALVGIAAASGTAGAVDTSFGVGGIVVDANGGHLGLATLSDGDIVGVGAVYGSTHTYWYVRRYDADGDVDTGFGTAGTVTLFNSVSQGGNAVAVQADAQGRLLVGGVTTSTYTFVNRRGKTRTRTAYAGMVVRLDADGDLDLSFGNGGSVFLAPMGQVEAMVIQPDGKIVVSGAYRKKGKDYLYAARLTGSGDLDPSFGSGGLVKATTPSSLANFHCMALQSTGRIVLGAHLNGSTWTVLRLKPNGAYDASFGLRTQSQSVLLAIAVDSSDRVVAAGTPQVSDWLDYQCRVVRYNSGGAKDSTFGSNGLVTVPTLDGFYAAGGGVLLGGNRITVGGAVIPANGPTPFAFGAVRLLSNGGLDASFGNGGLSDTISDGSAMGVGAFAAAEDALGRILIGGITQTATPAAALARFCDD